jgi:hypothetical protein
MNQICEVSNPEVVLKQLKNIMEMRLICIYLLLNIRNIWCLMNKVRKYILEVFFIRIIPSIKIGKEGTILGIEIGNGKMLISIHLLIYHIICYGD